MRSIPRLALVIGLAISFFTSYLVASYLAEGYFFDVFFYQKSPVYGYYQNFGNLLAYTNNAYTERRIKDVRDLFGFYQTEQKGEVKSAATDDKYRVVVIGDSFAYGLGVKQPQRYPDILEKLLNDVRPTEVSVLALPGDNIVENFVKFELTKATLHPDLYIVGIADNDLLLNPNKSYPNQTGFYNLLREKCPQREFIYQWPDLMIPVERLIVEAYLPSFDEQYANTCYLKEIVAKMVDKNTLFFNFYRVTPSEVTNETLTEATQRQIMQKYVSIIRQHGGQVFQLHDSDVPGNYSQVSTLEGHPSAEAHDWFARALFKEIVTNRRYGFSP